MLVSHVEMSQATQVGEAEEYMQGQRVEDVRIERLRFGLSPRTELCDNRHVAALAEVID